MKTHWRKIAGKDFLVGEMLDGKEVTLTIKSVAVEQLQNQKGKEEKPPSSFLYKVGAQIARSISCKEQALALYSSCCDQFASNRITPNESLALAQLDKAICLMCRR